MLKSAPRRIASALKCVCARATARPDFCRHCDSHRVGATVHWARVLAWLNLGGTCAACRFLTGCKDFRSVGVRPHPAHLADRRSLRLRADAGVAAAGGGHRVRPQPGDVATQPIAEVRGPGRPLRPAATVFRSCCLDRWKPRLEGTLEFVERRILAVVNGRRVRDLVEYPRRTLSAASGSRPLHRCPHGPLRIGGFSVAWFPATSRTQMATEVRDILSPAQDSGSLHQVSPDPHFQFRIDDNRLRPICPAVSGQVSFHVNEHDQVHGVDAPPHPITPVANNTFMSTDSCQCRRMG